MNTEERKYTDEQLKIIELIMLLSDERRERVQGMVNEIEEILKPHPDDGMIAFAFIGAGITAKIDG